MATIQAYKEQYTDLLHRFVVGLIHDETEAYAIVAICFEHLEKNISAINNERQAQLFLETGARKLCMNYLNKIYTL